MFDWQRKRSPEDVPTPIAVAVADFCRRAKAAATPRQVREALALLAEADDARVKQITDDEPTATPLGPMALIDVVMGTDARTAAKRHTDGYYKQINAKPAPVAEPDFEDGVDEYEVSTPAPRGSAPRPRAKKQTKEERVQSRVAPKRRADLKPRTLPQALPPASSYLPKRSLPAPRGRFTNIDPARSPLDSLMRLDAKKVVEELVDQAPSRFALMTTLEAGYVGKRGAHVTPDDVDAIVARHKLDAAFDEKERATILANLSGAKGAFARVANAMNQPVNQLEKSVSRLGITREVTEIRERYTREALSPGNFSTRLQLLGRGKYLEDLRIEGLFMEALKRDVSALLVDVELEGTLERRVTRLAKKHALNAELLLRAVERLGLTQQAMR